MNDVSFLMEGHVLQPDAVRTPLHDLYVTLQSIIIEPSSAPDKREEYFRRHKELISTCKNQDVLEGLVEIRSCVEENRIFSALKRLKSMFPLLDGLAGTLEPKPCLQATNQG
jgi:flagellar protein FlbT